MSDIICSIEECSKPAHSRTWCHMHYRRWRFNGSPYSVKFVPASDGEPMNFAMASLLHETDDCVIWPYASHNFGYGVMRVDGRTQSVPRWILENSVGLPPIDKNFACHTCVNSACISKHHLYWGSPQDNADDMAVHGTRCYGEKMPGSKLTDETVRQIRASSETGVALARRYKVTTSVISLVRNERVWRHVSG